MSMIGDWFRRLRGRPVARPAAPRKGRPKPVQSAQSAASEGLTIEDAPPPAQPSARVGAGGFDPYSSDAGYQKPHSWERVDHD